MVSGLRNVADETRGAVAGGQPGDFMAAMGWRFNTPVCVYADADTGGFSWYLWNGSAFVAQTDVAIAGLGETESVFIENRSNTWLAMALMENNRKDFLPAESAAALQSAAGFVETHGNEGADQRKADGDGDDHP